MNRTDFIDFLCINLPVDKLEKLENFILPAELEEAWVFETENPSFVEHALVTRVYGKLVHFLGYDLANIPEGEGVFDEKIFFADGDKNRCAVVCNAFAAFYERDEDSIYKIQPVASVIDAGWAEKVNIPEEHRPTSGPSRPDAIMAAHVMAITQCLEEAKLEN